MPLRSGKLCPRCVPSTDTASPLGSTRMLSHTTSASRKLCTRTRAPQLIVNLGAASAQCPNAGHAERQPRPRGNQRAGRGGARMGTAGRGMHACMHAAQRSRRRRHQRGVLQARWSVGGDITSQRKALSTAHRPAVGARLAHEVVEAAANRCLEQRLARDGVVVGGDSALVHLGVP